MTVSTYKKKKLIKTIKNSHKSSEKEDWIATQLAVILKNFYFRTLNKSYIAYFEDFKPMYKEAMALEIKTTWTQKTMDMDKLYEEKGITKKLLDLIRNQDEVKRICK